MVICIDRWIIFTSKLRVSLVSTTWPRVRNLGFVISVWLLTDVVSMGCALGFSAWRQSISAYKSVLISDIGAVVEVIFLCLIASVTLPEHN